MSLLSSYTTKILTVGSRSANKRLTTITGYTDRTQRCHQSLQLLESQPSLNIYDVTWRRSNFQYQTCRMDIEYIGIETITSHHMEKTEASLKGLSIREIMSG